VVDSAALSPWGAPCIAVAMAVGAIVLAGFTLALRRAVPVASRIRAAALGAAAGAWAGLGIFLFCPAGNSRHRLIGHVLPVLAFTFVGAVAIHARFVPEEPMRAALRPDGSSAQSPTRGSALGHPSPEGLALLDVVIADIDRDEEKVLDGLPSGAPHVGAALGWEPESSSGTNCSKVGTSFRLGNGCVTAAIMAGLVKRRTCSRSAWERSLLGVELLRRGSRDRP
jgi:hypothetical protein